jgi:hypothetical protein
MGHINTRFRGCDSACPSASGRTRSRNRLRSSKKKAPAEDPIPYCLSASLALRFDNIHKFHRQRILIIERSQNPVRADEPVRSTCSSSSAFPDLWGRVGCCVVCFEACSAFTRVTAYMLTESPRDLFTGGFNSFVTSTAAPIVTGWNHQLPGGTFTHCGAP